jgi:hypothetical protein
VPDGGVAGFFDGFGGKAIVIGFELLQTYHIGAARREPMQQRIETLVDAIYIEGGQFHAVPGSTPFDQCTRHECNCPAVLPSFDIPMSRELTCAVASTHSADPVHMGVAAWTSVSTVHSPQLAESSPMYRANCS